jgi:hypothetical protein
MEKKDDKNLDADVLELFAVMAQQNLFYQMAAGYVERNPKSEYAKQIDFDALDAAWETTHQAMYKAVFKWYKINRPLIAAENGDSALMRSISQWIEAEQSKQHKK